MTDLHAVVFDFDGTLMDTEWSIFEMAVTTFAAFGIELRVDAWAAVVGLADGTWWPELCRSNGWEVDEAEWWATYKSLDRSFRDRLPIVPGAVELLDALAEASIPVAVASSSEAGWIEGHLGRVGLLDRFASIAGADRTGGVGKPAPDVYLLACADLGVEPAAAVAIEDSRHGIAAAHADGLPCVVVPSAITSHTDLSAADLSVASLVELGPDRLRDLVKAPR